MSERLTGDFRKFMNKNFLGSWDVPDGEDLILTIDHVAVDEVQNQQGKERKMTLHFKERDYKPMVCNITNGTTIGDIYHSNKVEDWEGKKIALYVTKVNGFGKQTDALRVRDYAPKEETAICEGCGKPIEAHGSWTVNRIVTMSREKYGASLCWDCAKKMKEEQEDGHE